MKKAIKVIGLLGILSVFAFMSLGSGSNESDTKDAKSVETAASATAETKADEAEGQKEETKEAVTEKQTEASAKAAATIGEMVLVDDEKIKITATELNNDGLLGPELKLLIENKGDKSLTIQVRNSSVNGWMITPMMSEDVAPGKKANSSVTLSSTSLDACGIKDIADIELNFHIFDTDTWDTYLDTDPIKIETSAADGFKYEYDDSGDVLYDQDGIKIVLKGLNEKDSIFGPGVMFYIENNSDRDIAVQTRDSSINGFMIDGFMSTEVTPGKKAMDSLTFLSTYLEENGIDEIKDVEFSFHIFDSNDWNWNKDSETIKLTF